MTKKIKNYFKCLSNTFYLIFPLIFAHIVINTTSNDIYDLNTNTNYSNIASLACMAIIPNITNEKITPIQNISISSRNNNINYENSNIENKEISMISSTIIKIINFIPITIFKMMLVVMLVFLWKSNYFSVLYKTGVL